MKRSILFRGYYGMRNTGDDAFCAVAAWAARNIWNFDDIRFAARELPRLPVPARRVYSTQHRMSGQTHLELMLQLMRTQHFVYGGGSLFHSRLSYGNLNLIPYIFTYVRGLRVGAVGVSLGPYRSEKARASIREFLCRFHFLALRDRKSYEDACDMNLPYKPVVAFDLAALLPEAAGVPIDSLKGEVSPVLGVSICRSESFSGGDVSIEKRRLSLTAEALIQLARTHPRELTVRLFTINGHPSVGDEAATRELSEAISPHCRVQTVPYIPDPVDVWKRIAECKAVFSIRLHGAILACFAKTPFLHVEYHRKCTDFLDDVEYPRGWRIGDFDRSPDEVASLLDALLLRDDEEDYPVDLDPLMERARMNFTESSFRS